MKDKDYNKILYVGMGKTGTSAFGTACEVLGFRLFENDAGLMRAWNRKEYYKLWEVADKYDVFEDYPWPYTYEKFDEHYPNSKFVFVERPEKDWLRSTLYQSLRPITVERRKGISMLYVEEFGYKYLMLHEKELLELYRNHNKNVREYFKDRPNDFLEIPWELYQPGANAWKPLCEFLKCPIPNVPFPNRKNGYPYPNYERMKRIASQNPEKYYGW